MTTQPDVPNVGHPEQDPILGAPTTPTINPARPTQPDWADQGTCRTDPHPDRWITLPPLRIHGLNNPAYRNQVTTLKTVCAACPVRANCLYTALNAPERVEGVWGGTDEYERADLLDTAGTPQPPPIGIPALDGYDDAANNAFADRFTAARLAHKGYTNKQIATLQDCSPMTVSRLLGDKDRKHVSRAKTS